jgi:LCP family protein required for cell wall assembly
MSVDGTPVVDEPAVVEEPLQPQAGLIPVSFEEYTPPSTQSDIDIPAPVGRFVQPEGQVNILLMGSDQRPTDGGFRTDVILLLTLNPDGRSASVTSFPRDLYVYQPGWRVDRINSAYQRGGAQMMGETMEYNFGVRPDHYMLVNFWNFEQIIDTLGGVTVNVAQGITDEREGPGDYSVPSGNVHMDGETALWYVRSRGSSSDFDRTRREQEVLVAIFQRLFSANALANAPQLFDQYNQLVSTDLELGDVLPLIPLATDLGLGGASMNRYAIGPGEVNSFTTSGGGSVLRPIYESVLDIMRQALSVPL